MIEKKSQITFPKFSGLRCLMMPYIQGDSASVPKEYAPYAEIIETAFIQKGDVGFLTIDESAVKCGAAHRGARAKHGRALHTEAGQRPGRTFQWGGSWGDSGGGRDKPPVELEERVRVLLANNVDGSCALWNATHNDTTLDGDIGHLSHMYPYDDAVLMQAGELWEIGILTPHESVPVKRDYDRQFLRIVSSGVHGREPYFTENPLVAFS